MKVKRSYDASRRREQARARRLAVILAARDLFERDGFRPTTIAAIAAHAGVSAESVYKGFGTKAALAKAVFDIVIAGDDDAIPVAERPAMQAMRDEPDVRRKIAMFVEGLAQRQARSAGVQILIRDGRHVDDSLAPIWVKLNDEGLGGMTMLGRHLLQTGQLRDGIDLDEVRDVLWNYLAIDTYERLVLIQGWPLSDTRSGSRAPLPAPSAHNRLAVHTIFPNCGNTSRSTGRARAGRCPARRPGPHDASGRARAGRPAGTRLMASGASAVRRIPAGPAFPPTCVVILSWNMPGLHGLRRRAKRFLLSTIGSCVPINDRLISYQR